MGAKEVSLIVVFSANERVWALSTMKSNRGFSLLMALLLMASALVVACVLSSLLVVSSRESHVAQERGRLLREAWAAASMALGGLSTAAGPDIGFTYVGVGGEVVAGRGESRMRVDGSWVTAAGDEVVVRVEDLSQLSDEQASLQAAARGSTWAKSRLGRQALASGDVTAARARLAALALELGEPEWYRLSAGDLAPRGTGWWGRGLLANPVDGGWKRDWSEARVLSEAVGGTVAERLLSADPVFSADPAKGLAPSSLVSPPFALHHAAVPLDLRLSLGLFNSRSDGRHRLRFHATGRWWNPSAAPLLADAEHNLYLIEVEGAPEVEVRNLDAGAAFSVYLDDCPQEDFGIFSQGLREQGLWLWGQVADPRTYGMARRGLLPGEVYAFASPDPSAQPQGLARILTRTTWRMDDAPHGPGWVRPSPEVFRPTDRVAIAVRFRGPVTLKLRPAQGQPARDKAIRDYPSPPQVVLANIPFPDFLIETTGADYSRPDSSGYVIAERRACLRVSMRERPLAEWLAGARTGRLLKTSWDFQKPEDAAEWSVADPLLSVLDVGDWPTGPEAAVLWDRLPNVHAADEAGAFARMPVREIPVSPFVTVAGLPTMLPEADIAWSAWLDRAFVSAPPAVPSPPFVSDNPRLVLADLVGAARADLAPGTTAAQLCIAGPFNVNSRNPDAWEHFLKSSLGAWAADVGGPASADPLKGPWLATLASGAQLAPYGVANPVNLADARLQSLTPPLLREVVAQQSIREPTPLGWRRWAEAIVAHQPAHGWPYPSLEAFARSGLLEKALEDSGLNRELGSDGADGPAAIRPRHFLRAYAHLLTVHGDTFRIVARASAREGGAAVEVEWVVQRVAETQALPTLGRRFRVVRARLR